jgi:hypothetical protein
VDVSDRIGHCQKMQLQSLLRRFTEFHRMPRVTVNLMYSRTSANNPFYERLVRAKYAELQRRHRRFPLIRAFTLGVAICQLPTSFEEYFRRIEPSARRNVKKALRLGYAYQRIDFNAFLSDISEIWHSTEVRQGRLPDEMLEAEIRPCQDPPSTCNLHEFPYFAVLRDGKAFAYAGCLMCGDICMLEQIYGHAAFQPDGVVPLLITEITRYLIEERPDVKYFCYGTYFGASTTMRRFKRKFLFEPHRVSWKLG